MCLQPEQFSENGCGPYAGGCAWSGPDQRFFHAARLGNGGDFPLPLPGRLGLPLLLAACACREAHPAFPDPHAGRGQVPAL